MQRFFLGLFLLPMFSVSLVAHQADSFNFSLPTAVISSQNALEKTETKFQFGIMADRWIMSYHNWLLGPGVGLGALMPAFSGNESVSIKPYFLFGELRFTLAYGLFGHFFGVMPFFQIKSQLGSSIVAKNVSFYKSMTTSFEYALGPALGVCYWIRNLGFALSYGVTAGNEAIRQHLELALLFNFKTAF